MKLKRSRSIKTLGYYKNVVAVTTGPNNRHRKKVDVKIVRGIIRPGEPGYFARCVIIATYPRNSVKIQRLVDDLKRYYGVCSSNDIKNNNRIPSYIMISNTFLK